ncbi:MAG: xanthine dehydrogenase family protein molybdopterin-binding subunit [Gammaproteobacteria bacterium]|nr:xanthine dehydrogenase family protein molybdopterin-binding subunit [Gammaproteobacteria bacterium]
MTHSEARRAFLRHSLLGGTLIFAAPFSLADSVGKPGDVDGGEDSSSGLTPLLKIHSDNSITFFYPSPEMGQGVDTSLAQLFVEELGGDMSLVSVAPMPYLIKLDDEGNLAPVAVPQFSGGSTSISRNFSLLREAGAAARQLLLQAGARHFGETVERLEIDKSMVISKSGGRVTFGALVEQAAREVLPENFKPILKNPAEWKTIGAAHRSTQVRKIVTGQPLYGMDMDYPGAKIALMARSPFLDGYAESFDDRAARKLPGVHAVVKLQRPELDGRFTYLAGGVAVIADDFWTAKKARDLLKIKWNRGPHSDESSDSLHQQCDELLKTTGQIVRADGDFGSAIKSADKVITRTYSLPLVSHAQLEPQNCIAHVTADKCTIIGPMQSPGGASRMAADITGFERVDLDVRYTRLGGGFGRRLSNDHVAEAVTISKLSGLPVKLIWTREDDLAHDFYRPMGHHQLTAAVNRAGQVIAWSHRLAGTQKHYRRGRKPEEMFDADIYVDDFPAGLVDNLQYEYLPAKSGTPQGSWRAPAHTANAFVVQSFLDELAMEIGQDPLQLRLSMLGEAREMEYRQHGGPVFDTGRMANVLSQAAQMASWGRKMPANRALGIAGHFTFGGYCAQVAEVEMLGPQEFRVHKVYSAIDVGIVVNPEGVIAQVEGGINDGLSAAKGQQILLQAGRVITENFDTYPMLRIGDSVTEIDVQIIASNADPSGVGEMGLPPVAPAVTNAIKAAGGIRIRSHPISAALAS